MHYCSRKKPTCSPALKSPHGSLMSKLLHIHWADSSSLRPFLSLPCSSSGRSYGHKADVWNQGVCGHGGHSPDPTGRPAGRFLAEIEPVGCHCDGFLNINHRPGSEDKGVGNKVSPCLLACKMNSSSTLAPQLPHTPKNHRGKCSPCNSFRYEESNC